MELEESVIESTFAFSRFASLMLVLAIVFIVISLIQYKIKPGDDTLYCHLVDSELQIK